MEFQSFLKQLGTCFFVPATGVMTKNSWNISVEDLIVRYREYLSSLRQKEQLPSQEMRHFFSLFLSSSLDDFYAISLPQERFVIKTRKPVVHLQLYHCFVSRVNGEILPMVLHPDSFSFGLQFSYPQIYEDPKTHEFFKAMLEKKLHNTELFKKIVFWIRQNTKPASLCIGGKKVYAPFRLGKTAEDPMSYHLALQKTSKETNFLCM